MNGPTVDETVYITPLIQLGEAFAFRVRRSRDSLVIEALGEKPARRAMPEPLAEVAVFTEQAADGGIRVDLKINGQTAYTKYIGRLGWLELPRKMVFSWN